MFWGSSSDLRPSWAEEGASTTSLGEAIRKARAERGWTQSELAGRLGTTTTTISRWERGRGRPRRRLYALAQVLEMPPAELRRPSAAGACRNELRCEAVASRIAQALDDLVHELAGGR